MEFNILYFVLFSFLVCVHVKKAIDDTDLGAVSRRKFLNAKSLQLIQVGLSCLYAVHFQVYTVLL